MYENKHTTYTDLWIMEKPSSVMYCTKYIEIYDLDF